MLISPERELEILQRAQVDPMVAFLWGLVKVLSAALRREDLRKWRVIWRRQEKLWEGDVP